MISTPNTSLSIDKVLPFLRMTVEPDAARESFSKAMPCADVVSDDFLRPALLDQVLKELPNPEAIKRKQCDNERELRLASATRSPFEPFTRLLLYHLNCAAFPNVVDNVACLANLICNPRFDDAGLHENPGGGKLGGHADFNNHPHCGLDRCLNLLLYLPRTGARNTTVIWSWGVAT